MSLKRLHISFYGANAFFERIAQYNPVFFHIL
jgi:hypothetical protein